MAQLQASPNLTVNCSEADDLPRLGASARRALTQARITTLSELARHTEAEVARLHGMGPRACLTSPTPRR